MTQWLCDQFRQIEQGVESQIKLPEDITHLGVIMKRMFCNSDSAKIVTSKFLKLIPCDDSGNMIVQDIADIEDIVDTEVSFKIEFPHAYMGTHKNGQTVSCSSRVSAIRYKTKQMEEEVDSDTQLLDDSEEKPTPEAQLTPDVKITAEKLVKKIQKSKPKLKRLNAEK